MKIVLSEEVTKKILCWQGQVPCHEIGGEIALVRNKDFLFSVDVQLAMESLCTVAHTASGKKRSEAISAMLSRLSPPYKYIFADFHTHPFDMGFSAQDLASAIEQSQHGQHFSILFSPCSVSAICAENGVVHKVECIAYGLNDTLTELYKQVKERERELYERMQPRSLGDKFVSRSGRIL